MAKVILRNMWRRKARTFLTVFGIVVGIFALTVLGGLSARLTQQVNGAKSWYTNSISVVPSGGSLFGGAEGKYLTLKTAREIQGVPGVKDAVVGIGLFVKDSGQFSFGAPDLIIGLDLSRSEDLLKQLNVDKGRSLEPDDSKKALVGSTLADKLNAEVGSKVNLRGEEFEVVGILQPTLSAPDTFAFVSYKDGLELFYKSNPFIKQTEPIAGTIYVTWGDGTDAEALAKDIESQVAGIRVISPAEAEKQISQFSLIFNAILFGIAFIALIVGGLSIINTMVMSVSERTREIGLKRAIGADTGTILGEYLLESAMIGLLGGLIGMGLGLLAIILLNRATQSNNVTVFTISWLVVIGPVIFATVLGTLAGIFPALRASRLKPVESLRED